jgi:hypothetical protein
MRKQNYQNHRFFEPTSYLLLFPLVIILLGAIIVEWMQFAQSEQNFWTSFSTSALQLTAIILSLRLRLYALVAQDRAIRAEEQIRHFALTGKLLDIRLSIRQIVALRFASDAEFPQLAANAAEQSLSPKQIKESITDWRADWHRV